MLCHRWTYLTSSSTSLRWSCQSHQKRSLDYPFSLAAIWNRHTGQCISPDNMVASSQPHIVCKVCRRGSLTILTSLCDCEKYMNPVIARFGASGSFFFLCFFLPPRRLLSRPPSPSAWPRVLLVLLAEVPIEFQGMRCEQSFSTLWLYSDSNIVFTRK